MNRFSLDMQYGVRRADIGSEAKIECSRAFPELDTFMSVPVKQSDLMVKQIDMTKKWKRLGRPSKIRRRSKKVPCYAVINGTVWVHPEVYQALLATHERKERCTH